MSTFISDTQICNMALDHVGTVSTIESLATQQDTEAAICRRWYDTSRLEALVAFDWNFARRRLTLALHKDVISETSTDPLAGVWAFRYQYPSDCLVVRKIQNPNAPPDDPIPFDVETSLDGKEKTILTDMENAVVVYTRDVESTSLFSILFIAVVSHNLASKIAVSLTGKRKTKEDEFNIYLGLLATAPVVDANEQMKSPPREAEWIRGRA